MAPEKNGSRSVHDRVPTLERGNDQKRRVRSAHHTGPGEGRGDAVPVFAVGFNVDRGWGGGGRHRSRADRWGAERTGAVASGAPLISSGNPEKNPEFLSFFL